jgi:hypothetical protein
MLPESKFEEKFDILIKQISELKDKITKLENMLLIKWTYNDYNDYNDYNISNDVIMDNNCDRSICDRSIGDRSMCDRSIGDRSICDRSMCVPPPLARQNAFNN